MFLTRGKADIRKLTCNVALDVVKRTDTVEGLACNLGFVRGPDIVEVASPMRPTGCFTESMGPVGQWFVKLSVSLVTIGLKDAIRLPEVMVDVIFFPVRGKVVDSTRWSSTRPWPLISDIAPDPAFLDALAQPLVSKRTIQNPDWGVVSMEKIACHDCGFDPLDQWLEHFHSATTPIDERAVGNIRTHAGEDLVQAIKWQMVVELGNQDVSEEAGTRHAARYRTIGGWQLHHLFAAAAGFLQSSHLDDLHLRGDHIEDFADVFSDKTQFTTTRGA